MCAEFLLSLHSVYPAGLQFHITNLAITTIVCFLFGPYLSILFVYH